MRLLASSRRAAPRSRVLVPMLFAALLLRAVVPHGVTSGGSSGGSLAYCDGGYLRVAPPGTSRGERAGVEHAVCGHGSGQCPADACTPRVERGGLFAPLVAAPRAERGRAAGASPTTLPPARAPPRAAA